MSMKIKFHFKRALIGCLCLGLLALLWLVFTHHDKDYTRIGLDESEYLKDVREPIELVKGISFSDGGSIGLSFRDSKQVLREVCLVHDLFGVKNLTFGELTPNWDRKVAIGSREEQAFLGLLQRWYNQDLEAQEWFKRMEQWSRSDKQVSLFTGNESEQQRAKPHAVAIMKSLMERN